jgi:uncharacterized membrane protein YfcA
MRLVLSLAVCVPPGSICGVWYAFEVKPIIIGAFVGFLLGLTLAAIIYGPKETGPDALPHDPK